MREMRDLSKTWLYTKLMYTKKMVTHQGKQMDTKGNLTEITWAEPKHIFYWTNKPLDGPWNIKQY